MSFSKVKLSDYSSSNPLVCETNIVLVTGNPNKAQEISDILAVSGCTTRIGILPIDLVEIQGNLGKDYANILKEVTFDKLRQCWGQILNLVTSGTVVLKGKTLFIIEDSSFFLLGTPDNFPGHLIKGVRPEALISMVDGLELRAIDDTISKRVAILDESERVRTAEILRVMYLTQPSDNLSLSNGVHPRAAKAISQFACFAFDPTKLAEYNYSSLTDNKIVFAEGSCTGFISRKLSGNGGFAWDHCFEPDIETLSRLGSTQDIDLYRKRSFSEMIDHNPVAKNMVSQRYDATVKLQPIITTFVNSCEQK
jgi:inosine/xanthosine triphosphate pyrophosphatase family protein